MYLSLRGLGKTQCDAISKEEAIKEVFSSYDTKPAETQRQVDEANKEIATKITKQLGDDAFVTDENKVKKMKPETPLHEYTHLWTEALKSKKPEEWENVKKLPKHIQMKKQAVREMFA